MRNLFTTKTMIGCYTIITGLIIATAPTLTKIIDAKAGVKAEDYQNILSLVVASIGVVGAAHGRYEAGGVYTPKGIPGVDPSDDNF